MFTSVKSPYKPLMPVKKKRAWELDFLRGLAVLLMCFDHLMFDFRDYRGWFDNWYDIMDPFMEYMRDFARMYWNADIRFYGHYIFVFIFLFIVGTSCAFSRNNSKRGAELAVVSVVFSCMCLVLLKLEIMVDGVVFGILHCISLSVLCAAAVDELTRWNKRLNLYAPLVLGATILFIGISKSFWITTYEPRDYINGGHVFDWDHLPQYIMGTVGYGDDWFGLFPYVGVVFLGMYWGKAVYAERRSLAPVLDGKWNKPVCFVGRHALIFYLAHQIIIAGLIIAMCMCMGYRL